MNEMLLPHFKCRSCAGDTIEVLSLGAQYVSQFPKLNMHPEHQKVPLNLRRCHVCGLIQLSHTAPRDWLYSEYWYRSGVNESMVKALRDVVDYARDLVPVSREDSVLDIGANDGTLLAQYDPAVPEFCPWREAYEPSQLAGECRNHADLVHPTYFPMPQLPLPFDKNHAQFKHIHSIAMFYDLEDPGPFVAEIARLLHPEGVWVVQMTDLLSMLRTNGFDNICHEHLEYWSLTSFYSLVARYGLKVIDVQSNLVNGGSLRIAVAHREAKIPIDPASFERVRLTLASEVGLRDTNEPYLDFGREIKKVRNSVLKDVILANHLKGARVDLLGASTKGNTFLQYAELGPNSIRRAIERSPEKFGRTTVTGIPIVSEQEGRRNAAEVLLCCLWQFRDALIERERGKWPSGTKLVFALPELSMVTL